MKNLFKIVLLMLITVICKGTWAYASENRYVVEVNINGVAINFDNGYTIRNNTLYLPLRELLEKTGIMNLPNSYISWDNGRIEMCLTEYTSAPAYDRNGQHKRELRYYYGFEIDKAEYTLNPGNTLPPEKRQYQMTKQMKNAPVLENSLTYVPFEYIEYMINLVMINHNIEYKIWDIRYNPVTSRHPYIANDSISIDYAGFLNTYQIPEPSKEKMLEIIEDVSSVPHPVNSEDYDGTGENIIITKPSLNSNGKTLILSAHYDTLEKSPGANDNGSGVAVVIELARVIKDAMSDLFADNKHFSLTMATNSDHYPFSLVSIPAVSIVQDWHNGIEINSESDVMANIDGNRLSEVASYILDAIFNIQEKGS